MCAGASGKKYYPNGQLKDTVFAGNPSSTWQAISYELELLKKVIIWRVGNGKSIHIWRDRSIPLPPSRMLVSAKGRCRLKWVVELLDVNGAWRMDLL